MTEELSPTEALKSLCAREMRTLYHAYKELGGELDDIFGQEILELGYIDPENPEWINVRDIHDYMEGPY